MKIKREEIDIYKELQKIKSDNLSKESNKLVRIFGNRCIEGFLSKRDVAKNSFKKSKRISDSWESHTPKGRLQSEFREELNQLCKEKLSQSPQGIISYKKVKQPKDFNDFLLKMKSKSVLEKQKASNKEQIKVPKLKLPYHPESHLKKIKQRFSQESLYYPNYNSIEKHVPFVKIPLLKKEAKTDRTESRMKKVPLISAQRGRPLNNIKSSKTSSSLVSFEKYLSRNDLCLKRTYNESILSPKKLSKSVSVPIFSKMTPRYKAPSPSERIQRMFEYTPKYSSIFCNNFGYKGPSNELRKKKLLIRKIWTSFEVSPRYIVIPQMNKENIPLKNE